MSYPYLGAAPNREERRFMRCTSADSLFSMSGGKPRAANTIKNTFDNAEFELLEEVLVVEFIDSGIGISEVIVFWFVMHVFFCIILSYASFFNTTMSHVYVYVVCVCVHVVLILWS